MPCKGNARAIVNHPTGNPLTAHLLGAPNVSSLRARDRAHAFDARIDGELLSFLGLQQRNEVRTEGRQIQMEPFFVLFADGSCA